MKIDLDLSDIYQSEDGYKMKPDFVELVANSIASDMKKEVIETIRKEINTQISELIRNNIESEMPKILNSFLDYEYEEVTSWGEKKGTWKVRDRIAKALQDATGFKREDYWDRGKETPFTKVIREAVEEQLKPMTKELYTIMTKDFKDQCIKEAAKHLTEMVKK